MHQFNVESSLSRMIDALAEMNVVLLRLEVGQKSRQLPRDACLAEVLRRLPQLQDELENLARSLEKERCDTHQAESSPSLARTDEHGCAAPTGQEMWQGGDRACDQDQESSELEVLRQFRLIRQLLLSSEEEENAKHLESTER